MKISLSSNADKGYNGNSDKIKSILKPRKFHNNLFNVAQNKKNLYYKL